MQSSENQLQEEEKEEEGKEEEVPLERLRDVERKLGGKYGRNLGDWFLGFVQAPEAGESFGREQIITWRNRLRNRFILNPANLNIKERGEHLICTMIAQDYTFVVHLIFVFNA